MSKAELARAARRAAPTVGALAAAALVLDLLAFGYGAAPRAVLVQALAGTWGTAYGVGQVLFKATPLVFAATSVAIALRAGMFNVGAEGQIAVASLAAAVAGVHAPASLGALAVPLVLAVAACAGAAWGGVAGALKARFGAHEVITTIMLNNVASAAVALLMGRWLELPGTVRTASIAPGATLARLERWVPAFGGSAASVAFVLAVAVAFAVDGWARRSRVGRELAFVGANAEACAAEGIPVARRRLLAMTLAGALAALAVSGTVLGYKGYYEAGLGAGAGFGGIAVALLGGGRALGIVAAALLFGTLDQAGLAVNAVLPRDAMDVLQAVVIVALALFARRARDEARAEEATP